MFEGGITGVYVLSIYVISLLCFLQMWPVVYKGGSDASKSHSRRLCEFLRLYSRLIYACVLLVIVSQFGS